MAQSPRVRVRALAAIASVIAGAMAVALRAGHRGGAIRPCAPPSADAVTLRAVANAGVLLGVGGGRFLIDAPIRDGIPPYATSSPAERERLERAQAPYDCVDAILITHWHEDHFSPEAVVAHLASNPRAVLVSSPEVVERVMALAPALSSRVRPVLPAPGRSETVQIGGVPVRVLRIRHNPARRFPEQHVAFLIGESNPALHIGDADRSPDNFAVLRDLPRPDLLLAPYWFMHSPANRDVVRTAIAPRRVAALHVAPPDAAEARGQLQDATPPAVVLTAPAADIVLPRPPG